MLKNTCLFLLILGFLSSCEKYREYGDLKEVEETFTGVISVNNINSDVDILFARLTDLGTYSLFGITP